MKTSYPDTPLAPVNRQAATLLANIGENPKDTGFYLGLQEEAKDLDKAIVSMQAQLKAHEGEKNSWYRQCQYSLELAKRHRATVHQSLKSIVNLSKEIVKNKNKLLEFERQKFAAEERQRRHDRHESSLKAVSQAAHEAKMLRIEAANSDNEKFLKALREVLEEKVGTEERLRLFKAAAEKTKAIHP